MLFLLTACNPLRHYEKVAEDENRTQKKRELLAPVCAEEFPVKNSVDSVMITDSVVIHDTTTNTQIKEVLKTYVKDCPQLNIDSISRQIKARIKPDVIEKTLTKTITRIQADSAAIFVITGKLDAANKRGEQLENDLAKSRKRQKTYFWLFVGTLITLGVSHWIRSRIF